MKRALMLILALCLVAWAADNAVTVPQSAVNPQSAIDNRQSTIVSGAEAITIPQMLSYQGKLTDTLGQPVADTTYSVAFGLYTVPSGGSPLWSETQNVMTRGGLFSVLLGSVTPIGSVPNAGAAYLGMTVAGGSELTPRLRLVSAAYAYKADTANYALAAAGGGGDNAWVRGTPDSVLYTIRRLGIARGGSDNMLHGSFRQSHVNFGVSCTTGVSGQNYSNTTVGGGLSNRARAGGSTVGGGSGNLAGGVASVVAGGAGNAASGDYSSALGGYGDTTLALCGGALSGYLNKAGDAATDTCAVVAGGYGNQATGMYTSIGGGKNDTASSSYATVGGGHRNRAAGYGSVVPGGYANDAGGQHSVVGGGSNNEAGSDHSAVAGGYSNRAFGIRAFAGGGGSNYAGDSLIDTSATVVGGDNNLAGARYAFVGGGKSDTASGSYAAIGGGYSNDAAGDYAMIGGGYDNRAPGDYVSIGGGYGNNADTLYATIGGGYNNDATGSYSTVGGGSTNKAETTQATVGGGGYNIASGTAATVPGGYYSAASGNRSFAAGTYAKARGAGSFVWSDSCASGDSVANTTDNRWVARARGGVYFYTDLGMTTGVRLAAGGNSWISIGAAAGGAKSAPLDGRALLERVAKLPLTEAGSEVLGTRSIGPSARDFHAAFGYGPEDGINMADADGVALAAIQALYEDNRQLREELEALKAELAK
jgi:hypothetical protein